MIQSSFKSCDVCFQEWKKFILAMMFNFAVMLNQPVAIRLRNYSLQWRQEIFVSFFLGEIDLTKSFLDRRLKICHEQRTLFLVMEKSSISLYNYYDLIVYTTNEWTSEEGSWLRMIRRKIARLELCSQLKFFHSLEESSLRLSYKDLHRKVRILIRTNSVLAGETCFFTCARDYLMNKSWELL